MGQHAEAREQRVVFPALLLGLLTGRAAAVATFGIHARSFGATGRSFVIDLAQADAKWLGSAFLGGVIFNLSNILLVAAIDIAGLAVAFPIGVGLALVLGVLTTYLATGDGNVPMLVAGVASITVAIMLDAVAYKRLASASQELPMRGIVLSIVAGVLMGGFYSFVAQSIGTMDASVDDLTPGKLSPYTAVVCFSLGLFLSSFIWNSIVMRKPFRGPPVSYRDYFNQGTPRLHLIGILGGAIWSLGMSMSIIASAAAGPALSYGLGQGATMIGAIWGVVIWKEFKAAPAGTGRLLAAMFFFYLMGLGILVASRF
ncbi:MAG TPA: GRP family sugar transporter [Steroidobacter sp.]